MGKNLPSKAPPDAIAKRIQARRKELGWSLAELARAADLKAPSYVLHIERGDKAPSEEVAERLARALGEDVDSFRAWARLRSGAGTLDDALQSARVAARAVTSIENDPRHTVVRGRLAFGPAESRSTPPDYSWPGPAASMVPPPDWSTAPAPGFAGMAEEGTPFGAAPPQEAYRPSAPSSLRLRAYSSSWPPAVPLLEAGTDPDATPPIGVKTLTVAVAQDQTLIARLAALDAPFAYELSVRSARRAPFLLPAGFYAIMTRSFLPLEANEAYAVRVDGGVELGYVHWDGHRLALLPHMNPDDLVVFPARSERDLMSLIAGKVAIVAEPQTVRVGS
jgi:transcriptional regulator with XRE-family HTH domain